MIRPILCVVGDIAHIAERFERQLDNALHDRVSRPIVLALLLPRLFLLLLCCFGADQLGYSLLRFLLRVKVAGLVSIDVRDSFLAINVLAQLVIGL